MSTLAELRQKFHLAWPLLDERARRIMAANEAVRFGFGGISVVHLACGLSRRAIAKGIREIREGVAPSEGHIRRTGAGRKSITVSNPRLLAALEEMIDYQTRGDPKSPLRWICKSTRAIAEELGKKDHPVSHTKVAQILHDLNYILPCNRHTAGTDRPESDAQFRHINVAVTKCLAQRIPVISMDTKQKKRRIGQVDNAAQPWDGRKLSEQVQAPEAPPSEFLRARPHGIYDLGCSAGIVNVGPDQDNGEFALASIRGWWHLEGSRLYRDAAMMLIITDRAVNNGSPLQRWKSELQNFADKTGLCVSVCHFPPGTSKWNQIEHRLFSFITSNWRGESPRDCETIVNLIARTSLAKELKVTCRLDRSKYPAPCHVSDAGIKRIKVERNKFHGNWNYVVIPKAE